MIEDNLLSKIRIKPVSENLEDIITIKLYESTDKMEDGQIYPPYIDISNDSGVYNIQDIPALIDALLKLFLLYYKDKKSIIEQKKIFSIGKSMALTISPAILKSLKWEKGNEINQITIENRLFLEKID